MMANSHKKTVLPAIFLREPELFFAGRWRNGITYIVIMISVTAITLSFALLSSGFFSSLNPIVPRELVGRRAVSTSWDFSTLLRECDYKKNDASHFSLTHEEKKKRNTELVENKLTRICFHCDLKQPYSSNCNFSARFAFPLFLFFFQDQNISFKRKG